MRVAPDAGASLPHANVEGDDAALLLPAQVGSNVSRD